MRHAFVVLVLLLASASASAEGLRADESALSERLRVGTLPAAAQVEAARSTAARGAVALAEGRREDALRLFGEAAGEFDGDCALAARLFELGRGNGCADLQARPLEPAILEPPAAFLLVAAEPGESGGSFPAAVLVAALKALAPAGGLTVESTADRFRVTGSAALEGLWYLDDRLLLAARAAPGRGRRDADEALEAFRALRPPGSPSAPVPAPAPAPSRPEARAGLGVAALGVALELPPGWSSDPRRRGWLPPGADREAGFPPPQGALAIVSAGSSAPSGERRRNPLARRKPSAGGESPELAALPTGAKLLESRRLGGDARATTSLEWLSPEDGSLRHAVVRTLELEGRSVQVVAHLGDAVTTEQALQLLRDAHAARP